MKKLEEGSCAEEQEAETIDISKLTMIDVDGYHTVMNESNGNANRRRSRCY